MERRGRFINYDKQAVLQDIADGLLSASAIAKKHKMTRDMVYSFKFQAKKKNLLRDPAQKMRDLDAVESKRKREGQYAHQIYLLAQGYADGQMTGKTFFESVCNLLQEPIRY